MRFRLGFPLDSPGEPGYILVAAIPAASHFVEGGRKGPLREGSGAARAASLTRRHTAATHKLRFTPVTEPPPSESATPRHLGYSGNSDGAACALAYANPGGFNDDGGPIVLVSCSIVQVMEHHDFHGLKVGPVTDASRSLETNLDSLQSKWRAAQEASVGAGAALVLHEDDARLLSDGTGVPVSTTAALCSLGAGRSVIIALEEGEVGALSDAIGGEATVFSALHGRDKRRLSGAGDSKQMPIGRVLLLSALLLGIAVPAVYFGYLRTRSARMALVTYRYDSMGGFRRFFELLVERAAAADSSFSDQPVIKEFDQDQIQQLESDIRKRRWDLVRFTPYVYLQLKWRLADDRGESPFEMIACSHRVDPKSGRAFNTYRSILFAPKGAFSAAGGGVPSPDDLEQEISNLQASGKKVELYWGKHNSTSGYIVPCLRWGRLARERGIWREAGSTQEVINRVLFDETDAIRIGAIYDGYLEDYLATHAGDVKRQYDVLWESQLLPHGGIALVNGIDEDDASTLRTQTKALLAEAEKNPALFTKGLRSDVDPVGQCEHGQFDALERYILHEASPEAIETCHLDLPRR